MTDLRIEARLLDGRGGARALDLAELGNGRRPQGLLWVHLDYRSEEARAWLAGESGLDEIVVESLLDVGVRPRTVVVDDGLLISLRGVNLNPDAQADDMVAVRIWAQEDLIVTSRSRRLMSIAGILEALQAGRGVTSASGFVTAVVRGLTDLMETVLDDVEETMDRIEDGMEDSNASEIMAQLSPLRRKVIALRRYLLPQRTALTRLREKTVPWFDEESRLLVGEADQDVARYLDSLDAVRDRGAVVRDEIASQESEAMNKRMYLLSVVAAVFLPLGFLTGLLGINVGGIPGTDAPWAFTVVTAGLVAVGAAIVVYFYRHRWL